MPMDTGRCSVASLQREEPLAGTAPTARRWVLIEHPGPWSREVLDTPPLAGHFATRLEAAMLKYTARVLLIRRPGRAALESEARLWRVVDVVTGQAVSGLWNVERDLDAVVPALSAVSGPLADPAPSMILVCTHGVRDACCAIKGRPIAGMLARAFEDEVWECSHLHGHRFAGTALVMPDGACYGRLDQSDAVRVLNDHKAGQVDSTRLRGITELQPAEQAAHIWGLNHLARSQPSAHRSVRDVEIGSVAEEPGGRWTIGVVGAGDDAPESVRVVRRENAPAPLSCGKDPDASLSYTVEIATSPFR